MYNEDSIMTYEDFNNIEDKIQELTNEIMQEADVIPAYTKKVWVKKDFLLYNYLNNIENGIKNLGKYYFRPYGWQKTKTWDVGMSFSYRDVNRWWNDLNLIEERLDNKSNTLFPSNTLYPSDNLLPH